MIRSERGKGWPQFDSFTPKAVHWYFDIRDGQYGWIKPENTVNVDEGGLDSLVVGSADPKRKAFLKGPQTRNWTSFIEAITADGRALTPGIIFKGKQLQKQWFLDEFKQIADWYYITSPNGWTDDHIGIEWLERVYLPRTTPADDSDARLIILDGHGSHATDEWMATGFLNNVYCCYLPAHCSHGLQPLDNGVFNASKAAYRRELEKFASLTDSAPMDKVNFIRAYAKARRVGMTKKNILSGWRVTGNWPISRAKALRHSEIQEDKPNGSPRATPEPRPVIAKGFEVQQQTVAAHTLRIASLEEELARLKRGKKRKAVPNPNKRFMTLGESLAGKEPIPEGATRYTPVGVEFVSSSEQESESEAGSVIEVKFNTKGRRIRCIAHIINISLQAFLLASSKVALVAALESASGVIGEELLSQFSEVLASHRKMAAAERNIAKRKNGEPARKHKRKGSTASNTLHQNAWDKAVGLRLGMDNRTRWSSWYQVIDRVIRKKDKIQSFMSDHEEAIGDNRLLVGDWELLGKVHTFLQPFASATLYAEGDDSSISRSLMVMDMLLLHYEEQQKLYQSDEHSDERMVRAIDMGWFILSKYYRLTDEVPVYAAALLLDPRKRIAYIKQNWPKEWHEDTIASATAFWQKEFNYEQPSDRPSTPTSMPPPLAKKPNQLAILSKKLEVGTINASVRDDFPSFINVDATDIPPDCTPLEWWCQPQQRKQYPKLSRTAICILSIPAESSEPERTFSGLRRTCSWDRLRITCKNIEMIECTGNWLCQGLIRPLHENGMGLIGIPRPEGGSQDVDDDSGHYFDWY
ncbi:hypothetical protein FOVG_19081 [Fusarium oxysporum f. sp. pisi HDV247]|uniref:DDE-1 domain-containing protein n=1 Tax=Fusarium oxysporum f. sp. pisi HDV247 TaxID=1080344 RepID=W9NHI0_FUSOX|nr:hypothetical protein FOVG_19081 [Fusarium oxysporum f. sp. pisi HDV247]